MATSQGYVGIIRGVAVGSYGNTLLITLKDLAGNVQDVSAYTGTLTALGKPPSGGSAKSATVSFNSDGSDGIVSWSWADGDIDESGDWEVQVVLNSASARIKTFIAKMPVIPALAEDS